LEEFEPGGQKFPLPQTPVTEDGVLPLQKLPPVHKIGLLSPAAMQKYPAGQVTNVPDPAEQNEPIGH
jgi:hypothetical protein